jgi:ABC-type multidrug transport system fused ATPase/permease subunit
MTVRRCDTIVELDRGSIVAAGSYDFLLETSPGFRKLAVNVP